MLDNLRLSYAASGGYGRWDGKKWVEVSWKEEQHLDEDIRREALNEDIQRDNHKKGQIVVQQIKDNEVVTEKLWTPQVITGGKEPPMITGENWLISLDIGDVFLVKKRTPMTGANPLDRLVLQLFELEWKKGKAVRLRNPEGADPAVFFDSDEFCKMFDKFEQMGEVVESPLT